MKRYESYKDSGVEWIGEIPSHWEIIKTYLITTNLDGKRVPLNSEERGDIGGDVPYWGSNGVVDYINQYLFDEELVLVGEDGSPFFDRYKPVSFHVYGKVWINNHIHVLKTKQSVLPKYLTHSFNNVEYREYITGSTRDKLTQSDLNRIVHTLPPLPEQEQIVSFLDEKTSKIDDLIKKKEQKIEFLKEYRTSLINRVITKGLNPDVPMKDSGVEWIGQIPSHWEVGRFKYDSIIPPTYGLNTSSDNYVDNGVRFIRITDISDSGMLNPDNGVYLNVSDVPTDFLLTKNDVLFCRSGHTVGKTYLHQYDGLFTSGGYLVRLNFGSDWMGRYVMYVSKTQFYWDWIKLNTVVSTIENVNGEKYGNFQYPRSRDVRETEQIVSYLDQKTGEIDSTIDSEKKKIDLLKEYRQSLISSVITGKFKVVD
jgi:type I restriction enzyme S subunit